jgi:cytochrome c oxidase accessory protein FixG
MPALPPGTTMASAQHNSGAQDQAVSQSLYEAAQKIYPRKVTGKFATLRLLSVLGLLSIYYGLPWLRWEERQALLLDLPARKFYIFGWTFWPQDFIYLTFLLALAALVLFFFTALAGRLWCGYACPQTVWTEAFLAIERFVEGDRRNQIKLDESPWGAAKLRRKAFKHTLWALFALWTGFTFVGYFTPIGDLSVRAVSLGLGPWETFWVAFYGFATWGNAGFMREQVCKYMCPYARFQSAMFDKDTLIITYDANRGEQRGSRRRSEDYRAKGLGDCIDCSMCVQVCPTGIDIRDGLQYQCIACSACIDACDTVMEKMAYPAGLIRYDTQHGLEGNPTRLLRPRIVIYATLLALLFVVFVFSVVQRVPLGLDVIRDRNALYRESDEGLIENVYVLKILNMSDAEQAFTLQVRGIDGAVLVVDRDVLRAASGEVLELPVSVRADEVNLQARSTAIEFVLRATNDAELAAIEEARFLGPGR